MPIATLLLVATKLTAGFADALVPGSAVFDSLDTDCPQAASAANAAPAIALRMMRELNLRKLRPDSWVFNARERDSILENELRPSRFITRLRIFFSSGDDCVHCAARQGLGSGIFHAFCTYANLSPFAHGFAAAAAAKAFAAYVQWMCEKYCGDFPCRRIVIDAGANRRAAPHDAGFPLIFQSAARRGKA